MTITATQYRSALGGLLAVLEPRMFPVEQARCQVKLRLMPTIGIIRARDLRVFLAALSTSWLFTPSKRSDPLAGNTLADRVKLSKDGNTWLTLEYVTGVCADIEEWARQRNG